MYCYDVEMGEEVYKSCFLGVESVVLLLIMDDDWLLIFDEVGNVFVVKVGLEFEVVFKNMIFGFYWLMLFMNMILLFLRSFNELICICDE